MANDNKASWYFRANYLHYGPGSIPQGYHLLLMMGVFLYASSIANIFYTYTNDGLRLLGVIILVSYIITGAIVIHVSWVSFNKMTMFLWIWYSSIFWTISSVSLFFMQLVKGYSVIQMIYVLIVIAQVLCLLFVILKRNSEPIAVSRVFRVYLVVVLAWLIPQFILAILNGDGRWSGPDHVSWDEKVFGAEFGEISSWFSGSLYISIFLIGSCMWGLIKISQKWRALDSSTSVSIAGHLLYHQQTSFMYQESHWGYLPKGSKDFPDPITFLREEGGAHYFKRKVFRGQEEELAFRKVEGMGKGIFSCEVVGSDREPEYVKVMYGGKKGKWYPYEFEELAENNTK